MKKANFVFLGPPASGKSTQGKKLAANLDYLYISSGELVKKAAAEEGKLNEEIKERFKKGIPQPDEVVNELVEEEVKAAPEHNFILDSYPLSPGQCKHLDEMSQSLDLGEFWLIYIDLKENEALQRMLRRKVCPICQKSYLPADHAYKLNQCPDDKAQLTTRADDKAPVFETRYREYETRVTAVKEYFQNRARLIIIDGKPTIEEIHKKILGELKKRSLM